MADQLLTLFERGSDSLDDTFYELAFSGSDLQTVRYWWSIVSDGWKQLMEVFNAFMTFFESALEENA